MFPNADQHRALKGFEILRPLGSGGVGQVFLAKSRGGRRVAIKVLSDARERDDAFASALAREASLCARLTHPAIVQVRAFVEDEGFAAIVFDYVEGIALARLFRFCSALGARLPDRIAWCVVERVLSALAYAHTQKDEHGAPSPIVHRDVSPSNVLISFEGDVKLTDFGIAKMLGVSPTTRFGLVKGTLGCMAPEQARGEPVDERADVYAAGLLAWRIATGRAPFRVNQSEVELLRAMRYPRIKPLTALRPDLPERLAQAVTAALTPEARDRTLRAGELAAEVKASIDVERGHAELAQLLERWRAALDRPGGSGATSSTDSSMNHKQATLNYDEAAAIDDGPPSDGPTIDTYALPGDDELWKSMAAQGALGLPRASASESDAAGSAGVAMRIVKETPFLPSAPLKEVAIVFEGAPVVATSKADEAQASIPEPVRAVKPGEAPAATPARDDTRRRVALLLALSIAAMLLGAALTGLVHGRSTRTGGDDRKPRAGVTPPAPSE